MPIGKSRIALIAALAPLLCMAGGLRLQDYDTGADITGTEVAFAWDPAAGGGTPTIERKIVTVNAGDREATLIAKKVELNPLQEDVVNSFCYAGYCYAPHIFESPRPQILAAGASDRELRTGLKTAYSFNPAVHKPGTDKVRYVVFAKDDPSDSASVTVAFIIPAASPILRMPGKALIAPKHAGYGIDALGKSHRPAARMPQALWIAR